MYAQPRSSGDEHNPKSGWLYGLAPLPGLFKRTAGRREVQELTGNRWAPTLTLEDGSALEEPPATADCVRAHPA
jgi:hypothetical protein